MHHKAIHRNWVPAERHYHLYEHTQFPLPDNYYDAYEGRYAAQMQKMNIYRDMYEGHDLKMVAGMNSDSLLFDPWPHAFLVRWSRMSAAVLWMPIVNGTMNLFETAYFQRGGRMEISALFAGLYGLCGKRGRECRRNIGLFEAYRIG